MKVAISVALVPDNARIKKGLITTWLEEDKEMQATVVGHVLPVDEAVQLLNDVILDAPVEETADEPEEVENGLD